MTPDYLRQLADRADPDQLWRLSPIDQMALPPEKRAQLDIGVALRRYASDVQAALDLIGTGQSLLITQIAPNHRAVKRVRTPVDHQQIINSLKPEKH